MNSQITILGLAGSLRKKSYNKSMLNAAVELAPKNMKIDVFDLGGIPPFNQDLETKPPVRVRELKAKIRAADAVLIATPEYNYSVPGVLKNAIDWTSRPYADNVWEDKPVALMSASTGMLGGARAQYHLRQTFVFLNAHPLNKPEVMMPHAQEKISENGKVNDETTRKLIGELLKALVFWTERLRKQTDR
jgi:chromate reductase